MSLTEDDVRRIVRDELRQFAMALQDGADALVVPYETAEFEGRVFRAVAEVARETGCAYHPDEDCPRTSRYSSDDRCICAPNRYQEG